MIARLEPDKTEIETDVRWTLLQRAVQERNVSKAFEIYLRNGIDPILIKGLAAQLNYPKDQLRSSADIDLAVPATSFERADDIARSDEAAGLAIDLHKTLRHLDTVAWDDLYANSATIDIHGVPVRILRAEDHLRVLCVHWFTDGGGFRKRLWDIYYAVQNRPVDFDWSRCLEIVSPTRRRWIVSAIGLAHLYLDLNIDDLPFADEARDLPAWLPKAVEKEWASDVRLTSIHIYLGDPVKFAQQVRKRIPPNPIQSTIEMEGSFDSRFRFHYQIGSFAKRLGPSIRKVASTVFRRRI